MSAQRLLFSVCLVCAAVLGCSSQTPAITLREPKIFVPVCQLDSSVCLVYATVRWVPAVGADYQVVVSLQRSSMAVVPLEFRPVEGNETSFSVVFALNISDTEYRLRARILQGGSMIASSKDLILTFPQVVYNTDPITIGSFFQPIIDPCGYVYNIPVTVKNIRKIVGGPGASLFLARDWDMAKEMVLDPFVATVDIETPFETQWGGSFYMDRKFYDPSQYYRILALTIEDQPLVLVSNKFRINVASVTEKFTPVTATINPPSSSNVNNGDFSESLTISFDDDDAFHNALMTKVYGLDMDLCWNNGSRSLRLLTASPPSRTSWTINLPPLTSDFEYGHDHLFHVRVVSRSFTKSGSSSYPLYQYFAVSNLFVWLPGYLLKLDRKDSCLSGNTVVALAPCNSTMFDQRFEYDSVNHLIKYVGDGLQGSTCLTTKQSRSSRNSSEELLLFTCNIGDPDQTFYLHNSCSTTCPYVIYQNKTETVQGQILQRTTRCMTKDNDRPLMSVTTSLPGLCNNWISAGFSGSGQDIGVELPDYSMCWTLSTPVSLSSSLKLTRCHPAITSQIFTYDRDRSLRVSDGNNDYCIDSFLLKPIPFSMSGCSSKSKFVYEPVTSQVAVLKSDGTPRCIEVSGGNLRLHSCEAFNTAGALASLTYSLAFYGPVSVGNGICVMSPRASREWYINGATGLVAGFITWDTGNIDRNLEVDISLVYEKAILSSKSAITRFVLSENARNYGFYRFEMSLPLNDKLGQVQILVPGESPAVSDYFRVHSDGSLQIGGNNIIALEYNTGDKKLQASSPLTWKYIPATNGPASVVDIFLYWSPRPENVTWSGINGVASWVNIDKFYADDENYSVVYSSDAPDTDHCHCLRIVNGLILVSGENTLMSADIDLLSSQALQQDYFTLVVVSHPQYMYAQKSTTITLTNVCNDSLGLGDGRIADNQITASSIALTRKASAVRLNATAKGWIPSSTDKSPYIEISFNSPVIISAVATKGVKEQLVRHWVTKYNLFYKKLGEGTLIQYQRNGQPMSFSGNSDASTIVLKKLPSLIQTDALRLVVVNWQNIGTTAAGLQMELYGCVVADSVPSPTVKASTSSRQPTGGISRHIPETASGQLTATPSRQLATASSDTDTNSNILIIVVAAVGSVITILVVIALILICWYCGKRRRQQALSLTEPNTARQPSTTSDALLLKQKELIDGDRKVSDMTVRYVRDVSPGHPVKPENAYLTILENTLATETSQDYVEMDDVLVIKEVAAGAKSARIIRSHDLEMGDMLGAGEFGSVYKAEWKADPHSGKIEVAVKTLNAQVSPVAREEFLREASVMCSLDHPYLVTLLGISLEQPPQMITEMALYGALNDYLRKRNPGADQSAMDAVYLDRQLIYAGQITRAMEFLAKKRLVHRDLAARNVLVFSADLVKVSDFGLSRALEADSDYYTATKTTKLPLRWMAPECWNRGKFTPLSDVWSFGVTLWEIMSYAARPYRGLQPQDVIAFVEAGKRLSQPDRCPDSIYEVMKLCWQFDPHKRITFEELSQKLGCDDNIEVLKGKDVLNRAAGPVMIDYSALTMGKHLGSGAFGSVTQATWKQPNGTEIEVAAKSISPEARPRDRDAFVKEAAMMVALCHRNIVQMLGISLPAGTTGLLVVSELIPLGSLLSYLKRNQLQEPRLKLYATQIATGMAYLEEHRIIHRDLAARNILVAANDLVKVSDFGMSKALGMAQDYYKVSGPDKLPIYWVAPESLFYSKFSSKSDVWSFGVTMWEMWSGGAMPWAGIAPKDLATMLESGKRLDRPRGAYGDQTCCEGVCKLMESCWQYDPDNRPSFSKLKENLKELSQ